MATQRPYGKVGCEAGPGAMGAGESFCLYCADFEDFWAKMAGGRDIKMSS